MGSPDSKTRDLKITELLEKGFAKLPPPTPQIVDADVPIKAAPRTSAPAPAAPPPAAKPAGADEPVVQFTMPPEK